MSKRKPPSQRAERKLDETARAIARVREEAKPERPSESAPFASENKSKSGSLGKSQVVQKAGGQGSASAPRRQKKV